jgi:hypothetical protein
MSSDVRVTVIDTQEANPRGTGTAGGLVRWGPLRRAVFVTILPASMVCGTCEVRTCTLSRLPRNHLSCIDCGTPDLWPILIQQGGR